MTQNESLEVFQDLMLVGPDADKSRLRTALISHAKGPWKHARDREDQLVRMGDADSVIAFERSEGEGIDAVGLVLWAKQGGFEISNIVPLKVRELGPRRYNAALQDFEGSVARPAAEEVGFAVKTTPAQQGISDWLPPDAAQALRRFSTAANKTTGSAHPLDRQRWFAFLILAHREGNLDTDRLMRWLVEVENWPEDVAHDLVIEYDFGLALLDEYDRS